MQLKHLFLLLLVAISAIQCGPGKPTPPALNGEMQREGNIDTLELIGKWMFVYVHDSGKNIKPRIIDTIIINDSSIIKHYAGDSLISSDKVRLYKIHDGAADFELSYKNDSIGCIKLILKPNSKDTLVFTECNDFETARYYYKKIVPDSTPKHTYK
jgi:hypothetical protein